MRLESWDQTIDDLKVIECKGKIWKGYIFSEEETVGIINWSSYPAMEMTTSRIWNDVYSYHDQLVILPILRSFKIKDHEDTIIELMLYDEASEKLASRENDRIYLVMDEDDLQKDFKTGLITNFYKEAIISEIIINKIENQTEIVETTPSGAKLLASDHVSLSRDNLPFDSLSDYIMATDKAVRKQIIYVAANHILLPGLAGFSAWYETSKREDQRNLAIIADYNYDIIETRIEILRIAMTDNSNEMEFAAMSVSKESIEMKDSNNFEYFWFKGGNINSLRIGTKQFLMVKAQGNDYENIGASSYNYPMPFADSIKLPRIYYTEESVDKKVKDMKEPIMGRENNIIDEIMLVIISFLTMIFNDALTRCLNLFKWIIEQLWPGDSAETVEANGPKEKREQKDAN